MTRPTRGAAATRPTCRRPVRAHRTRSIFRWTAYETEARPLGHCPSRRAPVRETPPDLDLIHRDGRAGWIGAGKTGVAGSTARGPPGDLDAHGPIIATSTSQPHRTGSGGNRRTTGRVSRSNEGAGIFAGMPADAGPARWGDALAGAGDLALRLLHLVGEVLGNGTGPQLDFTGESTLDNSGGHDGPWACLVLNPNPKFRPTSDRTDLSRATHVCPAFGTADSVA